VMSSSARAQLIACEEMLRAAFEAAVEPA
jgi:hypothetical protein